MLKGNKVLYHPAILLANADWSVVPSDQIKNSNDSVTTINI